HIAEAHLSLHRGATCIVLHVRCGLVAHAPRALYYCWDDAPPFLISWAPPFIHPESFDGILRDYYRAPEWVVYTLWLAFISGVVVLPALFVWRVSRRSRPFHLNMRKTASLTVISLTLLSGCTPTPKHTPAAGVRPIKQPQPPAYHLPSLESHLAADWISTAT